MAKKKSYMKFVWAEVKSVKKAEIAGYQVDFLSEEVFTSSMFFSKEHKKIFNLKRGQEVKLLKYESWTYGFITKSGLSYMLAYNLPVDVEMKFTEKD
jgi:hypothetical protein